MGKLELQSLIWRVRYRANAIREGGQKYTMSTVERETFVEDVLQAIDALERSPLSKDSLGRDGASIEEKTASGLSLVPPVTGQDGDVERSNGGGE